MIRSRPHDAKEPLLELAARRALEQDASDLQAIGRFLVVIEEVVGRLLNAVVGEVQHPSPLPAPLARGPRRGHRQEAPLDAFVDGLSEDFVPALPRAEQLEQNRRLEVAPDARGGGQETPGRLRQVLDLLHHQRHDVAR